MEQFNLNVKDEKELSSKYHSLRVSFKEWIRDGFTDTMFCNEFNIENNRVTVTCGDIKKQYKLSIFYDMIKDGDLVVVGGKLK